MNKICRICKKELPIDYFRKSGKYYRGECKECTKALYRNWYLKNYEKRKEHISKEHKKHYLRNKERLLKYQKQYRESHKYKIKEYKKNYYQENKEKVDLKNKDNYYKYKEYYSSYYKNNKDRIATYRKKMLKNPVFKFKKQIRNMLYDSFKRQHKIKKEKSEIILGCSLDFFISYLLKTYKKTYGIDYDNKEKVHIDHIIPLSSAKTEEDVINLCHYTNLQLLKARDNLRKGKQF